MSLNFYSEKEDYKKEESINKYKDLFLTYENEFPSLCDALKQMFTSKDLNKKKCEELTLDILDKCKSHIDPKYEQIKNIYKNISKENAYTICAYTCESKEKKDEDKYSPYSPYRILNNNLVSENRKIGINNISKFLYILLKSLRKLPRYYPSKKKKFFIYIDV